MKLDWMNNKFLGNPTISILFTVLADFNAKLIKYFNANETWVTQVGNPFKELNTQVFWALVYK